MDNIKIYMCMYISLQHNIQLERIDDAVRDLDNAIAKCPTFAASYVQKSFAGKAKLLLHTDISIKKGLSE